MRKEEKSKRTLGRGKRKKGKIRETTVIEKIKSTESDRMKESAKRQRQNCDEIRERLYMRIYQVLLLNLL
jgi:hypothetical protein